VATLKFLAWVRAADRLVQGPGTYPTPPPDQPTGSGCGDRFVVAGGGPRPARPPPHV